VTGSCGRNGAAKLAAGDETRRPICVGALEAFKADKICPSRDKEVLCAASSAVLVAMASAALLPTSVLAGNPSPTGKGPPSQSCEEIELEKGGKAPGKSFKSPGSPFNEPGLNSPEGGIGGQNYNAEKSQYDVACYQVSTHH
jgi:hypothetical protein